jgi:hypothetical protein
MKSLGTPARLTTELGRHQSVIHGMPSCHNTLVPVERPRALTGTAATARQKIRYNSASHDDAALVMGRLCRLEVARLRSASLGHLHAMSARLAAVSTVKLLYLRLVHRLQPRTQGRYVAHISRQRPFCLFVQTER